MYSSTSRQTLQAQVHVKVKVAYPINYPNLFQMVTFIYQPGMLM